MSPARLMAALHAAVKREDQSTDALLTGVSVEEDAGSYHLVFPEGGAFAMRLLSQGSAHQLIGEAFASVLGHPVAFDCVEGSCKLVNPAAAGPADFGTVSAAEAAAPAPGFDEGYYAAQDAYAAEYEELGGAYGDYEPAPAAEEPAAFDPGAYRAQREQEAAAGSAPAAAAFEEAAVPAPLDDEAANSIADALSVFGGGIKFEEV